MNHIKRSRVLELFGGSLVLAGCTVGGGALQPLGNSGGSRNATLPEILTSSRRGLPFPALRPDGSMPLTSRHVSQVLQLGPAAVPQIINPNCYPDRPCSGSPGPGPGGIGQADKLKIVGNTECYGWTIQNYSEIWDCDAGILNGQVYWSINGTVITCRVLGADGTSGTASIDYASINPQGTTIYNDGTQIVVDSGAGTYSVTTPDTTVMNGTSSSYGPQTLSARRISGPRAQPTITAHGSWGGISGGGAAVGHCFAVALMATAGLLAAIAIAIAAMATACGVTVGTLCAVATVLASAMIGEAVALYKKIVASACG